MLMMIAKESHVTRTCHSQCSERLSHRQTSLIHFRLPSPEDCDLSASAERPLEVPRQAHHHPYYYHHRQHWVTSLFELVLRLSPKFGLSFKTNQKSEITQCIVVI